MNKIIHFTHEYDKLERDVIPTVRSVDYMKEHDLKIGDEVTLTSPSRKMNCILIGFEDMKIKDMGLAFLKYDCSPLKCESIMDYIDILNSFTKFYGTTEKAIKRIIYFHKKRCLM